MPFLYTLSASCHILRISSMFSEGIPFSAVKNFPYLEYPFIPCYHLDNNSITTEAVYIF